MLQSEHIIRIKPDRFEALFTVDYSMFSASDFVDLPSLAATLYNPTNEVSRFLHHRLSPATQESLANNPCQPESLQLLLVADFNQILRGDLIYDARRFSEVALRPKTRWLLAGNPSGNVLVRLNRMLIEDTFSKELARMQVIEAKGLKEQKLKPKDWLINRYAERCSPRHTELDKNLGAIATGADFLKEAYRSRVNRFREDFLADTPLIENPMNGLFEWGKAQKNWKGAQELLLEYARGNKKIVVFGDFDCDGVSSVTLVLDFLKALGVAPDKRDWFIPHRLNDGYGVRPESLNRCLLQTKPELLIVVDCGTNSMELLNGTIYAGMRGVRALVIDHHHVHNHKGHTDDIPLINPWAYKELAGSDVQNDNDKIHDLRNMCASGLIYLFCMSLAQQAPAWDRDRATIIAGLASVADVMPMLGTSRAIVKNSIRLARGEALKRIPGLELLHHKLVAKMKRVPPIDENTYGFLWGPCINASGRIDVDCATASVELLTHEKPEHLERLANFCYETNCKRISLTHQVLEQAKRQAKPQVLDQSPANIILVAGEDWNLGVVGIVAARLRELHNRPAIVCGREGSVANWRGSGRSLEGVHIGDLIKGAGALLASGGGHEMACGLSFTAENRHEFNAYLNESCLRNDFTRTQKILAEAEDFTAVDWHDIQRSLRPFGRKNEQLPIILQSAKLESASLQFFQRPPKDDDLKPAATAGEVDSLVQFGPKAKGVPAPAHGASRPKEPGLAWSTGQKHRLLDEMRRGELSGLIIGRFISNHKPDAPVVVGWLNVRRALREWRVGQAYMLQLSPYTYYSHRKRVGRFTVLNSWELDHK